MRFHALFSIRVQLQQPVGHTSRPHYPTSASILVCDDDIGGCIKSEAETREVKCNENINGAVGRLLSTHPSFASLRNQHLLLRYYHRRRRPFYFTYRIAATLARYVLTSR